MSALDAALDYCARGWATIPVPHRAKRPVIKEWQKLRITADTAPRYFDSDSQNIGVLLGMPSGELVDVDLDCREALALAASFLPATGSVFGRASKQMSHRLYVAAIPRIVQFEDPENGTMLLELRSTGGQTVFPGSTHESGEAIEWAEERASRS